MKVGEKKNRLTMIGEQYRGYALFKCECGTEKEIRTISVSSEITLSCGCYHKERISITAKKHGMLKTPTYETWRHIKDRCLNKNSDCYKYYQGRGITMCEEWKSFDNFYRDMGDRPDGKTLDRIDNSKGYFKENCRWATHKEQQNNTRSTRFFTYNGKTQSMKMWSEELGISYQAIRGRLRRTNDLEKVFKK